MILQQRHLKFRNQNLTILYRDDSDLSVIEEIFVDKMYRSVENIISTLTCPILDIGAHIGLFSIHSAILNPKAKIIALEPEPNNFSLLQKNLTENQINNVKAIQSALVADDSNNIKLYLSKNTHNHSTAIKYDTYDTVPATNLNKLISKFNLNRIGLLKLDAEGEEFNLVNSWILKEWQKIEHLVLEYHEDKNFKRNQLENTIRSHGFSVEHFPNQFNKRFGLLLGRNRKV